MGLDSLHKNRLEAFSDGVFAILITILVLELKAPHSAEFSALQPLLPIFIAYVLSFVYIGIYWNNHHHLLHAAKHISGSILWYNLHLLFWLSLIPFATAWMGENHFAGIPAALYGVIMLGASIAYKLLQDRLVAREGAQSHLALAIGSDRKGKLSTLAYVIAIALASYVPWVSFGLYVGVALIWFIPDRRIESLTKRD
jgi:uncharacterized membrane protein